MATVTWRPSKKMLFPSNQWAHKNFISHRLKSIPLDKKKAHRLVRIVIAVDGVVVVGIAQSGDKSPFPIKLKIAFTHLHSIYLAGFELEKRDFHRRCSHFASIELIRSQLKRVAIT